MKKNALGLGILFLLFSIFFGGIGVVMQQDIEQELRNSVPVNATVQGTGIDQQTEYRDGDRETMYYPVVNYTYTVNGTDYTSDDIYPGGQRGSSSRSDAEDVISDYSPGQTVTAYYLPAEPGTAFLLRERSFIPLGIIAVSALFVLYSLYKIYIGVTG